MLGFRVVRGPGWSWNEQDGGEGHTGTIVEVDSPKLAKNTVIVQWDCGKRTNYCIGHKGLYDLCVLDSAPAGVKHPSKQCDGCNKGVIYGARWSCQQCNDTDLCTPCYMDGRHDISHKFYRFDSSFGSGIAVPPRCECSNVLNSKGCFPGAQVVRGHNWEWEEQDIGKTGIIKMILDKMPTSQRSVAEVEWKGGSRNIYRVGHRGKVDLKFLKPGSGSRYYYSHLQVCGKEHQFSPLPLVSKPSSPGLKQGDAVRITLNVDLLKRLQVGHGGWDPFMEHLIGKNGWVHRITDAGDVRVRYERHHLAVKGNAQMKWTIHPAALGLVTDRDDNDHSLLRLANEESLPSLEFSTEAPTDEHADRCEDLSYLSNNLSCSVDTDPMENIRMMIRFSQTGDLDGLRRIMSTSPALDVNKAYVDDFSNQNSYSGNDIVQPLNSSKARCDVLDLSSWTPLHHAIASEHVEIVRFLLDECSADVNMKTGRGSRPLHLAVSRGVLETVQLLLDRGADITLQDCDGNTAMHLSVDRRNNHDITSLLSGHPVASSLLSIHNKTGHNPLHCAIVQGDEESVDIILKRHPALSNHPTQDGRHPLHLAAELSQSGIVRLLLTKGCDVNVCNSNGESPLYTACCVGSLSCVEVLVGGGADVNSVKGKFSCVMVAMQSPLHQTACISSNDQQWAQLRKIVERHSAGDNIQVGLLISSYLIFHGASLPELPNHPWMQCLVECHRTSVKAVDPSHNENDMNDSLDQLNAELEKLKEERQCAICMDLKKSVVFIPCGHGCCAKCKKKIFTCPFCNSDIQQAIKTYP